MRPRYVDAPLQIYIIVSPIYRCQCKVLHFLKKVIVLQTQHLVNALLSKVPEKPSEQFEPNKAPFRGISRGRSMTLKIKFLSSTFVGLDLLTHELIIAFSGPEKPFFFAFREHSKPLYIVQCRICSAYYTDKIPGIIAVLLTSLLAGIPPIVVPGQLRDLFTIMTQQ